MSKNIFEKSWPSLNLLQGSQQFQRNLNPVLHDLNTSHLFEQGRSLSENELESEIGLIGNEENIPKGHNDVNLWLKTYKIDTHKSDIRKDLRIQLIPHIFWFAAK